MKLKALIFDVDGTLADTEEAHRRAFNDAFRRHGLDWNWSAAEYAHLLSVTGGKERLEFYIESLPLRAGEQRALMQRIAAIHKTKTDIYAAMVEAGQITLRDGVERLIDEAALANVQLAIASTTTLGNIEALLRSTLGRYSAQRFAVVGAGDQVRRKKPAPEIYRFVLRELDRSARECVAIEDSANGLAAAKQAGLYTVVTPSDWTRADDFTAADLVLPSLGSLGIRDLDRQLGRLGGA
ncbi:MAG TPA: HAD-IA family hydrolase [Steroidobacteraceae bacterium]|nr:HAD-IA family hydrolase [Steroidobacteraceae bacterium]